MKIKTLSIYVTSQETKKCKGRNHPLPNMANKSLEPVWCTCMWTPFLTCPEGRAYRTAEKKARPGLVWYFGHVSGREQSSEEHETVRRLDIAVLYGKDTLWQRTWSRRSNRWGGEEMQQWVVVMADTHQEEMGHRKKNPACNNLTVRR